VYPSDRSLTARSAHLLRALGLATITTLCAAGAAAQPLVTDDCGVAEGAVLQLTNAAGECAPAPILDTEVTIAITGIVARTRVKQSFYNPGDGWVEGVYIFPLPEGAAVDHLRMLVGDRIIEGQIREREKARAAYESAKRSGVKASLVEQQRPNIFTTSVANIGPEETVEIVIELQDVVRYDSGEMRLRFPTVVAARHGAAGDDDTEGDPAHEPDSDPVAFLTQAVERASEATNFFSMDIDLDPGFPLRALYSPTHAIDTREVGDGIHHVRLSETLSPTDRDFVLAWAPRLGDEPQAAVFSEEIDGDTYILLMMVPPLDEAVVAQAPTREVILVIDTSGSMYGPSIEQAKLALQIGLDQLRPSDWFNVIEFNDEARLLFPASTTATAANLDTARAFVDGLRADGGTDIAAALAQALETAPTAADLRQVIFMTDGAVGNEAEIFAYVEEHLGTSRLFTIGIGAAPNAHFMRKAAEFGRGTFTFIARPEDVSAAMDALFAKIERPALTNLRVDWDEDEADAWPAPIPDLYAGEPLIVSARLAAAPAELALTGSRGGEEWSAVVDGRDQSNAQREVGVGKLWARRKVEGLMDGLALGDDRDSVHDAVVAIGLEHHLVTPFTSLIAVDVTPTAPAGDKPSRLIPLNRPAGAPGTLPRTATPSLLHAFTALALLLVGLALRQAERRRED